MQNELIGIIEDLHFTSYVWLIILPASLMALDVVTGLVNAWAARNFQSTKVRSGLAKKAGEMVIILLGIIFTFGLSIPEYILDGVSLYIILMELMSIVENLDKLGAPLPKSVKRVINNIGEAVQNDDIEELSRKIAELERTITILKKE